MFVYTECNNIITIIMYYKNLLMFVYTECNIIITIIIQDKYIECLFTLSAIILQLLYKIKRKPINVCLH